MLVEILGDKEYVIEDSFLLDASITTEEIWAPLPHFDPTGQPDKYSCGITGARTSRYKRKGFFIISFASEEITSLLLLNTICTGPGKSLESLHRNIIMKCLS